MQPQDPRRQPSVLSSLDGLAQPVQSQQPIQQPVQQAPQAPVVQPTATDQDANLVPDELTDELQQIEQSELLKKVKDYQTEEGRFSEYSLGDMGGQLTVHEGDKGYTIRNIDIPEEYQRLGIGSNIYRMMNQQSLANTGEPLMSTKPRELDLSSGKEQVWELSDKAKGMWNKLVEAGEAIQNPDGTYQFTKIQPEQKAATQPQPIEFNDRFGKLREAARNYATPEEFIQDINKPQGYKDVGFIDQPDLINEKIYEVPLDKISEFQRNAAVSTARYKTNAEPTDISDKPVTLRVEDDGTISIADGIHRVAQAIKNGDTSINAIFEPNNNETPGNLPGGYSLSELFNQANRADTQTPIELPPQPLRGAKKYTEADIKDQKPDIQLAKDVTVKDTSGQPVELKEGENLTPYMMKDGRVVIQDGVASTISPSTLEQIERSSFSSTYSEKFAPELKDKSIRALTETPEDNPNVKAYMDKLNELGIDAEIDHSYGETNIHYKMREPEKVIGYSVEFGDGNWDYVDEETYKQAKEEGLRTHAELIRNPITKEYPDAYDGGTYNIEDLPPEVQDKMPPLPEQWAFERPKHLTWTLGRPADFDNYREVMITSENKANTELMEAYKKLNEKQKKLGWTLGELNREKDKAKAKVREKYGTIYDFGRENHFSKSLHNGQHLEAHYRMNDREWENKKVSFLEEAQSDLVQEAFSKDPKGYMRGMYEPYEYKDAFRKRGRLELKLGDILEKTGDLKKYFGQIAVNILKSNPFLEDEKPEKWLNYNAILGSYGVPTALTSASEIVTAFKGELSKPDEKKLNELIKLEAQQIKIGKQLREIDIPNKVPYVPGAKDWLETTLKTALIDAVDSGAEIFAWTNGDQQADRYNLSKAVKSITKEKYTKSTYNLLFNAVNGTRYKLTIDKNNGNILETEGVDDGLRRQLLNKPLYEAVGVELAQSIQKGKYDKKWKAQELEMGGDQLKNIYNVRIGDKLQKMLKTKVKSADMGFDKKRENYNLVTYRPYKASDEPGGNKTTKDIKDWNDIKVGSILKSGNNDVYDKYNVVVKKYKDYILVLPYERLGNAVNEKYTGINPKTGRNWNTDINLGIVSQYKIKELLKQKSKINEEYWTKHYNERKNRFNSGMGMTGYVDPYVIKTPTKTLVKEQMEDEYERIQKRKIMPQIQQYIELTPVIKAIIKGEKPPIKASGRKY